MAMRPPQSMLCGIIEGFYGRCWDWSTREAYAELLPQLGLNAYLYCPKADSHLRRNWQQHWPSREWRALVALARRCEQQGLRFGPGLSPFALYRHYGRSQKLALRDKIRRLGELSPAFVALLFDDMPGDIDALATRQAEIVHDVRHWLEGTRLLMCPTYYSDDPVLDTHFGARAPDYLQELGRALPRDTGVFWTGTMVCSETISGADLEAPAEALGRPLSLWDNYPVNDGAKRSRHLYLEPLPARESDILGCVEAHFCNPMNQAWLSVPALRGLAELHGASPAADLESRVLGSQTWALLQRDRTLFADSGLDGLTQEQCERLQSEYGALPGEAARELSEWLQGGYRFDPDCLTD